MESTNIRKGEPTRLLETEEHPMDEMMFYALSSVYGFSKNNGSTYSQYLKIWASKNNNTQYGE
tara:strand:- start:4450 stop:4638 length:189 start_codon:yes stop_codon:yes gene_type:complete